MSNSSKVIFHGDDLGLTLGFNHAIKETHNNGLLTSTSIRANGLAFEDAIKNVVKTCPNLSVGIHLNLVEGNVSDK